MFIYFINNNRFYFAYCAINFSIFPRIKQFWGRTQFSAEHLIWQKRKLQSCFFFNICHNLRPWRLLFHRVTVLKQIMLVMTKKLLGTVLLPIRLVLSIVSKFNYVIEMKCAISVQNDMLLRLPQKELLPNVGLSHYVGLGIFSILLCTM